MSKFVILVDLEGNEEIGHIRFDGYLIKLFDKARYGHCDIEYNSNLELRRLTWYLRTAFECNKQRCRTVEYRFASQRTRNIFLGALLYDLTPQISRRYVFYFDKKVRGETFFNPYPRIASNFDFVIIHELPETAEEFRLISDFDNPLVMLLCLIDHDKMSE